MDSNRHQPYSLIPIAQSGDRFTSFAPYVPSINNRGIIAFQATTSNGGSGIFTSDGSSISTIVDSFTSPLREICSHPDIADDLSCCFYATLKSGIRGVFLIQNQQLHTIADSFGPLGPTMNNASAITFRAHAAADAEGIFTFLSGRKIEIARTGSAIKSFQGLPVIQDQGLVVFRADLPDSGHEIFVSDGSHSSSIARTGAEFASLANFPIINNAGTVAFCATLSSGASGVFIASGKTTTMHICSSHQFASFRGVLINNSNDIIYYATPIGGSLGVFTGLDPVRDLLLAIGSPLFGSTVTDFALNPVSINDAGQLAIRVQLADDRQFILRADPRDI